MRSIAAELARQARALCGEIETDASQARESQQERNLMAAQMKREIRGNPEDGVEGSVIEEFDGGLTRRDAEDAAARAQGFSNVVDLMERLEKATGKEGSADDDRR
jgi:hypothetical protein